MPGGLLKLRDFRLLWTADLLSQFGNRINLLAVPLLAATTLHASAFGVSMLRTLQTLAYLALGLQVGAWCDRMRNRPLLIATDLGRFAVYASIPLAAAFGVLTLWQLFTVVTIAGVLAVFFEVGHQTYLPRLLPRAELVEGNAKLQANISVAAVAAPSAGGYLVQYFGGAVAVAANAVTFLWSAVWLRGIRSPEQVPPQPPREPLRREIREGLGFVFRHPVLRPFAHATALTSLFQSMQLALGVVFLLREIHLSPGEIGLVNTTGLVGALVGACYGRRAGQWFGEARLLWVSGVLIAAGYVLMALTRPGWAVACYPVGNFVTSFGIVVANILQVSYEQAVTPERLRGRVTATTRFLIFGTAPVGSLLGGALASTAGLRTVMWVAAAGLTVAAGRLVCSPLRGMRTLPEDAE
ncbi:MFS transporter [Amycolatopsis alkalitolerans]|uniref:MFS transporter n=1 Tax=Amycolatopsis alkalitolerans TaxID=2547244 RepID=A0A5C4M990_9PSEU|nr:MFS transporter [Amycolatopsis alkalitolerans]TNC28479.1 MFS transporter [Amycolatopsis alkalitolerans]